MSAGRYSFAIEQGATFDRTVTWRDNAGALVDLTSYTATMKIKDPDGTTIATPTLTLGGAAGTIAIHLSAATTRALTPTPSDSLVYDLLVTAADGVTLTRLLQGRVRIDQAVS
jgi:hypothetical protein